MTSEEENSDSEEQRPADSTGDDAPDVHLSEGVLKADGGIEKAQVWISAFLIAVVGVIAFSNAVNFPYHLDDRAFLVENDSLHRLESVAETWDADRYRPLTALSLSVNWVIGNGSSVAFHVVNVLLHVLNGVLVFLICRRVLGGRAQESVSMVAGMVFVVHPAVTQTVNHLANRSVLLGALFMLLSVLFYLRAVQSENGIGYRALGASLVCFVLAWASSSLSWVLPILILIVAVSTRRQTRIRTQLKTLPLYIGLLLLLIASGDGVVFGGFASVNAAVDFIRPVLFPLGLLVEHSPHSDGATALPWFWLVLVVVAAGLMRVLPVPALALLWFLVALFAPSVFGGESSFSEDHLYLPLAGLVLILPWCLHVLPKPPLRVAGGLACVVLVIAGMALTSTRNNQWRSEAELWIGANEACPRCYGPQVHLGILHLEEGERMLRSLADGEAALPAELIRAEALDHFKLAEGFLASASRAEQADADLWYAYARVHSQLGQPESALVFSLAAVRLDPVHRDALLMLTALKASRALQTGDRADLMLALDQLAYADGAIELPPEAVSQYARLVLRVGDTRAAGRLLARLEPEEAERVPAQLYNEVASRSQLEQSIQSAMAGLADREDAGFQLAVLRAQQLHLEGRYLDSMYLILNTVRGSDPPPQVWTMLGVNSAKMGSMNQFLLDWPEGPSPEFTPDMWQGLASSCAGAGEWTAALEVMTYFGTETGSDFSPLVLLGHLAESMNDLQRAAAYYQQQISLDPTRVEAWLGMADLLLDQGQADAARNFIAQAAQQGATDEQLKDLRERAGATAVPEGGLQRTIIR